MDCEIVDDFLIDCFTHQLLIKMYHFQTKWYRAHKVVDKHLNRFQEIFDRFFESAQGVFGTLPHSRLHVNMETLGDEDIIPYMNWFADRVENLPLRDRALANIRDEMLGDLNRTIYLLRFR
jgi:hypothetical protein